jgi:superfamily II DNA/RNA helicase
MSLATQLSSISTMSSSTLSVASGGAGSASSSVPSDPVGEGLTVYTEFDEMGLSDDLLRGIFSYGFEKPSKIQRIAIKPMMNAKDILAQSQSGTGKTGTFTIGATFHVDPKIQAPQVLVISPTRELAQQTEKVARGIGQFLKVSEHQMGLKVLCATGGQAVDQDLKALRNGAQFIVGTPGRLFDLIRRERGMRLDQLKYLILDEADELLADLFAEQVKAILGTGAFPPACRLAMFSATMPLEVLDLASTLLTDPVKILLPAEEVRLEGIQQFYIPVQKDEWKYDTLCDLYKHMSVNQGIIFVNRRQTAEKLTKQMTDDGFTLECIHGEMEPAERKKRMADFRSGLVRILVATDIISRGIDVQTVSVVINYEMPTSRENYFHRIGRTGRYGRKGVSINLIGGGDEMEMMRDIEKHYVITIPELPEDLSVLSKVA